MITGCPPAGTLKLGVQREGVEARRHWGVCQTSFGLALNENRGGCAGQRMVKKRDQGKPSNPC